ENGEAHDLHPRNVLNRLKLFKPFNQSEVMPWIYSLKSLLDTISDCGVKSPPSLPPVKPSTRRRELIMPWRACCLKVTIFPVTRTKRASFSKQPNNTAPKLSVTLRKP